jgi:putative heme iron utilization protein
MKNTAMEKRLTDEISEFIDGRMSLNLATIDSEGMPFASYAPFAIGDNCIYLLLSDVAGHAVNLKNNPNASVLIIEDEQDAQHLFARVRVNLTLTSQTPKFESEEWKLGLNTLKARHGEMIENLAGHTDFNLFKLTPVKGRYVKGFGKAYSFENCLNGENLIHMRDGHVKREA